MHDSSPIGVLLAFLLVEKRRIPTTLKISPWTARFVLGSANDHRPAIWLIQHRFIRFSIQMIGVGHALEVLSHSPPRGEGDKRSRPLIPQRGGPRRIYHQRKNDDAP